MEAALQSRDTGKSLPSAGFTMIELLVALVIVGILAGLAAPSVKTLLQETRLSARYNNMTGAFRYARSEAVKRSSRITVCARATASSCSNLPQDWDNGWLIFVEANDGSGSDLVFDGNDTLLKVADKSDSVKIRTRAIVRPSMIGDTSNVQFNSLGLPNWDIGTVVVCDERDAIDARAMAVSGAGMLRKINGDGKSIPLDALGVPIKCP